MLSRQGLPTVYTCSAMQLQTSDASAIVRIVRAHGATEVRLFGSRACDEATEDSDIDLLVTMSPGRSLLDLVAIKQDIEDALGVRTDVVTAAALSPHLRDQILADAILLGSIASDH